MGRRSNPDGFKNPRRVMAGKMAYARRKAAQDEADKPAMQIIGAIIFVVVLVGLLAKMS